jgi:hypothetical protein
VEITQGLTSPWRCSGLAKDKSASADQTDGISGISGISGRSRVQDNQTF